MLFLCDMFDTKSCEILNRNPFICPKILYFSISYPLFGINIEILYNVSSCIHLDDKVS